jgi:hypothetical protein
MIEISELACTFIISCMVKTYNFLTPPDLLLLAMGADNFANVIFKQNGDLMKAEELARESYRIRTLIHDQNLGLSCNLLAGILKAQGKFGDETRGLYEHYLAISIRKVGPDGYNTAVGYFNIGSFYHQVASIQLTDDSKRMQLLLAKSYYDEAHRICSKIHGHTHPSTVDAACRLTTVSRELSQI